MKSGDKVKVYELVIMPYGPISVIYEGEILEISSNQLKVELPSGEIEVFQIDSLGEWQGHFMKIVDDDFANELIRTKQAIQY